MNVLILTPDAVGSTLLQRLITIYMQFCEYDRPVINLHELTNGLEKYFSPEFNREIVSKKKVSNWGYHQSLQQIVEVLSSVDHYKTSRLAHYHLVNRQDPLQDQVPFYNYLNENFYIISCRRKNVFEHALSRTLSNVIKKLNVYSGAEKIDTFLPLYRDKIEIDQMSLIKYLDAYKHYADWVDNFFHVSSYFIYEDHLPEIEKFILSLPFFSGQTEKLSWDAKFGISVNDWNRCQHAVSDIGSYMMHGQGKNLALAYEYDNGPKIDNTVVTFYQRHAHESWPAIHNTTDFANLPDWYKKSTYQMIAKEKITNQLVTDRNFDSYFGNLRAGFDNVQQTIKKMQELDIIVSPPPIKKQTLEEKKHMIKNFNQCVATFNDWVKTNARFGPEINDDSIQKQVQFEQQYWKLPVTPQVSAPHDLPAIEQ